MRVSLIAAMSANRVIGYRGRLPWNLPDDLRRFRKLTLNHPIVMGRKTYESIGKALPLRENLVVSRQAKVSFPGAKKVSSLDEALGICRGRAEEVFVIGGAEIYRTAIGRADRIYLTEIHGEFEGDVFFPLWQEGEFEEVSREDCPGEPAYSFVILERARTTKLARRAAERSLLTLREFQA